MPAPDPALESADVSVALCTRNGAAFIAEQVRSILAQQPAPAELVVGDDASSDETVAIIERVFEDARRKILDLPTRLRVIRRESPLGVSRNFEETIAQCSSTLIALSDQDDVWPSGRLARLVPLFDDEAVLLVHTDARLVDGAGADSGMLLLDALEASAVERRALAAGTGFPVLLRRNLVTGATVLLRRSLAESARPFPQAWLHDEWLAMIAAVQGGERLVEEPWTDYRQHGANQVGASAPTWSRRWKRLREPRDTRSRRLIARAEALREWAESAGISAQRVHAIREKVKHERRRAQLPRWQPLRIPGVIAGVAAGRYARFSRGGMDVLRDLVQPPTARR